MIKHERTKITKNIRKIITEYIKYREQNYN